MQQERKVALVTGASGNGMGRSIALTLADHGFAVAVNYRNSREKAEEIVRHLAQEGKEAMVVKGDVMDRAHCENMVREVLQRWGRIDVCVIGPGAGWNPEPLLQLQPEASLQDLRQEVAPVYHLLPLVLDDMKKRKWGRIIGIATNLTIPSPAYSYNAAKAGRIQALMQAVMPAWEMGVTVNVVCPGPVDPLGGLEEACAFARHEQPWTERENITPQDMAEGIAFLCSPAADYISGCQLPYLFRW